MSAVQDALILDAVADDRRAGPRDSREAIRQAINHAAPLHSWRISPADLRPYYPAWIIPQQVGPCLRRLRLRGHLILVSHNARYGSKGNGDKPAPVYRVDGVIPREAVQP